MCVQFSLLKGTRQSWTEPSPVTFSGGGGWKEPPVNGSLTNAHMERGGLIERGGYLKFQQRGERLFREGFNREEAFTVFQLQGVFHTLQNYCRYFIRFAE